MIIKDHEIPHKLLQAEVLRRRLKRNHVAYQKIEEIVRRERAGYYGEKQVDYPLSKLQIKNAICHDLRLPFDRYFFQMDTLILTPKLALILEVKNLPGIISFNTTSNKMIRTKNGLTEYYDDPVIQAQEQNHQLRTWLDDHGHSELPVEHLVVMVHKDTILNISPPLLEHQDKMIPLHALNVKLREVFKKYADEPYAYSQIIRVAHQMLEEHQPYKANLLKTFSVKAKDLNVGVMCPKCESIPMLWKGRRFQCWKCHTRSNDAYLNALKEFYVLFGNQISKRDFMWFTKLDRPETASYLLKKLHLPKSGHARSTKHVMSFDLNEEFDYLIS